MKYIVHCTKIPLGSNNLHLLWSKSLNESHTRKINEAICIKLRVPTVNRDQGYHRESRPGVPGHQCVNKVISRRSKRRNRLSFCSKISVSYYFLSTSIYYIYSTLSFSAMCQGHERLLRTSSLQQYEGHGHRRRYTRPDRRVQVGGN